MIGRILRALGVVAGEAVTVAQWVNDLPPEVRTLWLDATRALVRGDDPDVVGARAAKAAMRQLAMRAYRP